MIKVYIIMGVSGFGKIIIGKLLVKQLVIFFFDVDDFYFNENIEKMVVGVLLNDDDRIFWFLMF